MSRTVFTHSITILLNVARIDACNLCDFLQSQPILEPSDDSSFFHFVRTYYDAGDSLKELLRLAIEQRTVIDACCTLAQKGIHPFFLASGFALIDRLWTMLRDAETFHRDRSRTCLDQRVPAVLHSSFCYKAMKEATYSEFVGDTCAAKLWSAVVTAVDNGSPDAALVYPAGQLQSSDAKKIADEVSSTSQPTSGDLRVAIQSAKRLNRLWYASSQFSCPGGVNENTRLSIRDAAESAEIRMECLYALAETGDLAVSNLLRAALAASEVETKRALTNAVIDAHDTTVTKTARRLLTHALHTVKHVCKKSHYLVNEIEELRSKINSKQLFPRIHPLYVLMLQEAEKQQCEVIEYLARFEAGSVDIAVELNTSHEQRKNTLFCHIIATEPRLEKLERIKRRIAALSASATTAGDLTAQLELRCWVLANACAESAIDAYLKQDPLELHGMISYVEVELCGFVVERIVATAVQYERECRCEWRPEVKQLLGQAAHWARTAAAWTLDRIESESASIHHMTASDAWTRMYDDEADLCAQTYRRAAQELVLSINAFESTAKRAMMAAELWHTISMMSERSAEIREEILLREPRVRSDLITPLRGQKVCESHERAVLLAKRLVEMQSLDAGMFQGFIYWTKRALSVPLQEERAEGIYLTVAKRAHDFLPREYSIAEKVVNEHYLFYYVSALEAAEGAGVEDVVHKQWNQVLRQFECDRMFTYDHEVCSPDGKFNVSVAGAVVGVQLAQVFNLPEPSGLSFSIQMSDEALALVNQLVDLAIHELDKKHYAHPASTGPFEREKLDTLLSIMLSIHILYKALKRELVIQETAVGAVREPLSTLLWPFKLRVLTQLLKSSTTESAVSHAWEIFVFGMEGACALETYPDGFYELATTAVERADLPLLGVCCSLSCALKELWEYVHGAEARQLGANAKIVQRNTAARELTAKHASLRLAILQAQRRGKSAAVQHLREAAQYIEKAGRLAEKVARLSKKAKPVAQTAQIEKLKDDAAAAERRAEAVI